MDFIVGVIAKRGPPVEGCIAGFGGSVVKGVARNKVSVAKSSLLRGLLGELDVVVGLIYTIASVAKFCESVCYPSIATALVENLAGFTIELEDGRKEIASLFKLLSYCWVE